MSMYSEKHDLFLAYKKETDKFINAETNTEQARNDCDDYINSKEATWKNIFDPESGKMVGFLIIGKEKPHKPVPVERFIIHAYVMPEYRNRGLMTERVVDYESRHHCSYAYLVAEGNKDAIQFWNHLFEKMKYESFSLEQDFNKTGFILSAYKPSEE